MWATYARSRSFPFTAAVLALFAAGCEGDDGDQGPPGPPGDSGTDTELEQGDALPGLVVAVQSIAGGSASGGRFRVGDRPIINFRLQKSDGSDWDIAELSAGRAILSGPTFNYQRVILEVTDLLAASVAQADGSYTYTYATAIPATYAAPINDSPAFGIEDGELAGEDLLEGTYTVGLTFSWDFTVDGESERDSGNATVDFVLGNSGTVEHREAVRIENCNRCHDQLRIHGGRREEATMCVLCHTAGAEDDSGTGVSIDFKVMIHKIHAGKHLPSVLGVSTNANGSRNYLATPKPYLVSGNDFSEVPFPAWPQGLVPMPRDTGYSALSSTDKATEDTIRSGPSNCVVCHGDPDGDDGPLTAPAQGDLYRTQPSRQACGSCHDDVIWGQDYAANEQKMGPQANNSNCKLCHGQTGTPLAVFDAHLHPLLDPTKDAGVNIDVSNLVESGTNDGDDTLDPGEKLALTFRIHDDAGVDIPPSAVANPSVVISGPTENYNLLLNTSIPSAALTGPSPFTVNVPKLVILERVGVSNPGTEAFVTDFSPHWDVTGALTSVLVRTGNGPGNSVLDADTIAPQNYVDVASATGFARDDTIVVGDGTADEEYVKIQLVDGKRLWFSSPSSTSLKAGLERAHAAGAIVRNVTTVTKARGTEYTLAAATGTITEVIDFGPGVTVLASYWTDYVLPDTYPLALNDSPDLGESVGQWSGKALVDGTYSLGIWTSRSFDVVVGTQAPETTSYRSTAEAKKIDFLVGSATEIEPYALIASGSSCFNCHQELAFHGFGRKSFDSCVLCHGTAGAEDRPPYVAANAPDTTGTTVSFRTMLHKIHMGKELANASTYGVVGFGSGSYPNNFAVSNFAEVEFPSFPAGVANCTKCHANEAWHEPAPRAHPTDQGAPVQRWAVVCGACHDSTDEQAHIRVQTDSFGNESCGVCHGAGKDKNVTKVHKIY